MIDERGLTVPINYLVLLGVMTLLSAGLLVSTSAFVEDQQERSIRAEFQVIGNRMATDLAAVDRLAQSVEPAADGSGGVRTEIDLPGQVAGSAYRLEITSAGDELYLITLTSTEPDVSVSVPFRSRTGITPVSLDGDDLTVTYSAGGAGGTLVVTNA